MTSSIPRTSSRTTTRLSATTATSLDKKSSALDVIQSLNRDDAFAPYVGRGNGLAVVTGGNSGIGAVSVETLALSGLTVVLCARDVAAGEVVRSAVSNAEARARIRVQALDLADLASVERAAGEIVASLSNGDDGDGSDDTNVIDVLLNNAGVMATPTRTDTAQGLELQFGTNHVGHHLLTRRLLPHMNQQGGRVVTVASTAHNMGELDFTDLNYDSNDRNYTPWGAYGQSKLANVLFAKALQDRLNNSSNNNNIQSVSLHPGVIATNLWKTGVPGFVRPFIRPVVGLFSDKTSEQGAATNVYCSLVDASKIEGGAYFMDCRPAQPNASGQDRDGTLRNKLWEETERIIREKGFALKEEL